MRTLNRKDYFKLGLTAFLTTAAILLFHDMLSKGGTLALLGNMLASALSPIAFGAIFAYMLAPMVNKIEQLLFAGRLRLARERGKSNAAIVRMISVAFSWAVVLVVVGLMFYLLLPEIYRSTVQIASNIEVYYRRVNGWLTDFFEAYPQVNEWMQSQFSATLTEMRDFLKDEFLPRTQQMVVALSGGVSQFFQVLFNLIIGIIVSIYFLAAKERVAAACRKIVCAFLKEEQAALVFRGARRADDIFSGFFRGKIVDSIIIGVLCYLCCTLLQIPYTAIVAVVVGITNIIPYFGPFLGAIPSAFLILLVSPTKALTFAIFILILQQVDGNIIGPKILGGHTGLSSLWVITAIMLGGTFFGVAGMFFGVPVCACLLAFANFVMDRRLRAKNLPTAPASYYKGVPHAVKKEEPSEETPEEPSKSN